MMEKERKRSMTRIVIKDLLPGEKISPDEMRKIRGGYNPYNPDQFSGQFFPRSLFWLGPQPEPPDEPYPGHKLPPSP
jgi:hypothetical protein